MAAFREIMFGSGWTRFLPPGQIALLGPLTTEGPMTIASLHSYLLTHENSGLGLDAPAWDPLEPFTDEKLSELEEHFPTGHLETAEEANAAQLQVRASQVAAQERYFEARGLAVDHTLRGTLDFMLSCGVLRMQDDRVHLVAVPPLPGEVLPLSADEIAEADQMRWDRLHESSAQEIIREFDPEGESLDEITTNLTELAARMDRDVETTRHAISQLLSNGDFTTNKDIETLSTQDTFVLSVDWEAFNNGRIGIQFGDPED